MYNIVPCITQYPFFYLLMTFLYQRIYILLSNHVYPKTPKTPNHLVDKNPTKTSTKNPQQTGRQKPHPKIPVTSERHFFIFPSFPIYIRIQKKNRYTLKNRKNRVTDVSALIFNHLAIKSDVTLTYQ